VQCFLARTALGWSVSDLGRAAEMSYHTVERFERGDRMPSIFPNLAQALEHSTFNDQRPDVLTAIEADADARADVAAHVSLMSPVLLGGARSIICRLSVVTRVYQ
jgi:transcriptional regulator with XRE-family HTH domain